LNFSFLKHHNFIVVSLYLVHIALNFLESSALVYFYYLEILVFIFLAFTKDWKDLVIPTIFFFFIEGQGRVITNYNIIFRTIFDLYLLIIVLKSAIKSKSLLTTNKLPKFFNIMIVLHFSWYFIQLFNYQSVGMLGVLLAAKIYVFPILMFYMFLREKVEFDLKFRNQIFATCSLLLFTQCALIIYQKFGGESTLINISPYYSKIIGEKFSGLLFRPFGTSFISGGISVHFAYMMTFLFFGKTTFRFNFLIKILIIVLTLFACFTMQVRTSMVQMILILALSSFMISYASKARYFIIPGLLVVIFSIPTMLKNAEVLDKWFPELSLGYSIMRIQALSDIDEVKSQRATPDKFYKTLVEKLTRTPFGLGPARTGAANSMFVDKIKKDLEYDMNYSWTLDNLFISLAIDFGWGMVFYTLLIVTLPLYLLWNCVYLYFKYRLSSSIAYSCSVTSFVILLSNWGAIAIPYNPVSFFFWFFSACAIYEFNRLKSLSHTQELRQ
jgi:hypothetical protein